MMSKKAEKIQELEIALGQIDKEIKTSEMKLDTINKTMVTIREKELLINRYETSIEEIKKQTTKLGQEIAPLNRRKSYLQDPEQTGELNQLREKNIRVRKRQTGTKKNEMVYAIRFRH